LKKEDWLEGGFLLGARRLKKNPAEGKPKQQVSPQTTTMGETINNFVGKKRREKRGGPC